MPSSICLASTFPLQFSRRRRGGFLTTFVVCSSIRGTPLEKVSSNKKVSLLLEAYNPKKRNKELSLRDARVSLDFFLLWSFVYEDVSQLIRVYPQALAYDVNKVEALFNAFVQVGFSQEDIKTVVLRFPEVLRTSPIKVKKLHEYFKEILFMESTEFVRMLVRRPSTLTLSVEQNVHLTCQYFLIEMEMDAEDLKKVLRRFPQLLACSVEQKIKPIVHYYVVEIGIAQQVFCRRLKHQPTVLGRSLDSLKTRVEWIKRRLKYSDDDLTMALTNGLTFHQYSTSTLEKKISNLSAQFRQSAEEVGALLRVNPQLLCFSPESLNSKIHFLTEYLDRDLDEILSTPRILWCSIEKRIKPRCEELTMHSIPFKKYALSTLFYVTDQNFQKLIEKNTAEKQ